MIKLEYIKQKGMVNGFMTVAILLLAISLPVTVLLVQKNQENRSNAASEVDDYGLSDNEDSLTDGGAVCGSADGKRYAVRPTADLCSTGDELWLDSSGNSGNYLWSCVLDDEVNADNVGTDCSAEKVSENEGGSVDGRCGDADGGDYKSKPNSDYLLCKSGKVEWVDEDEADGDLWWNCSGVNEGEMAECSLTLSK